MQSIHAVTQKAFNLNMRHRCITTTVQQPQKCANCHNKHLFEKEEELRTAIQGGGVFFFLSALFT